MRTAAQLAHQIVLNSGTYDWRGACGTRRAVMSIARRIPQPPERWIIHGRLPKLLAKDVRVDGRREATSPAEPDESRVWEVGGQAVRAHDPRVRPKLAAR
jgi:hypothetical protein